MLLPQTQPPARAFRQPGASSVEWAALLSIVAALMVAVAAVVGSHSAAIGASTASVLRCWIASFAGGGGCSSGTSQASSGGGLSLRGLLPGTLALVTLAGALTLAPQALQSIGLQLPSLGDVGDFLKGTVAGIGEWFVDVGKSIYDLGASYIGALWHGNPWAWAGTIIVGVVIAALALTGVLEAAAAIAGTVLLVVGVAAGVVSIASNLGKIFTDPSLSPYQRGELLGKSIVDGVLTVVSLGGLLKIGRAAGGIAAGESLASGEAASETAAATTSSEAVASETAASATRDSEEASRVYRVQGGDALPKVSHERLTVDENGRLKVVPEPGKTRQTKLYVTFDDPQRARVYLRDNRPGGYIISFEVDPQFVRDLRASAVRQAEIRANPGAPEISDPSKTTRAVREALGLDPHESTAYGLPRDWIRRLEEAARPGSVRIERAP